MDQFAAASVLDVLVHYITNSDDLANLFDVCKSFRTIGRMIIDAVLSEGPYKAPLWFKRMNYTHACIYATFRICPVERPALEVEWWCDTTHNNSLIHVHSGDDSHDDTYDHAPTYDHIPTCPCSLENNPGYKCECEDESDYESDYGCDYESDYGCDYGCDYGDNLVPYDYQTAS